MPAGSAALPPRPLRQFVLKVHGRCDLACDHCYVYEHADQSWRTRSTAMAPRTLQFAARRIAEHATRWSLPSVRVILHGGEPLLLPPESLDAMLADLRAIVEPATHLEVHMQSNGVRLDEVYAGILLEHGVRLGISLDGDASANDRHRRFRHGGGSHHLVLQALALLRRPAFREIYSGLLCTIDIRNDPIRVYEALLGERPPRIDFLLPHATWDQPPWRPDTDPTPYATWLLAIYHRWLADGQPMRIRMFDGMRSAATGGPSGSEQIGGDYADIAVVETDGAWEQADSLKTAFDGAPATGLSVFTHTADDVAALPAVAGRLRGLAGLSRTCQACPVVHQCGGGLYAHRYRTGSGFDNPSTYCDDLKELAMAMNAVAVTTPGPSSERAAPPVDLIDQIGSGYGDEATIRYLSDTQTAITRALVAAVAEDLAGHPYAAEGWELLVNLDRAAPGTTRNVLAHPYVREWAVRCLRTSRGSIMDDRAHLSSIAAAAAIHAGLPTELTVAVRDGQINLPSVGSVRFADTHDDCARLSLVEDGFVARGKDSTVEVRLSDPPTRSWTPTRSIATDGWNLLLEDTDPFRDCHGWTPADRLTDSEVELWCDRLATTWKTVLEDAPGYAAGLRYGLRTIVPLQLDPGGMMRASTARQAFGSLAAALADHEALAVMLVHEFQHGKLGAVLDIYDLYEPNDLVLSVGWRPDPRPVEAALQGAYAHLAVADIWRIRSARLGPKQAQAAQVYRQYRDWTIAAVTDLADSGVLTSMGRRLTTAMSATIAEWS